MNNAKKRLYLLLVCLLILPACKLLSAAVATPSVTASLPAVIQASATPTWLPTATRLPGATTAPTLPAPLAASPTTASPRLVRGYIARQHLEYLSGEIGARPSGSGREGKAAQYIRSVLDEIGYETQVQLFTFENEDGEELTSANLVAIHEGLSPRQVVVGAHYDSGSEGKGADDNASGVAVMLEVAEAVYALPTPYTIVFVAFGAEEEDLNGSRYYVRHMSRAQVQNTAGMINLDSLIAGDMAYVYGDSGPGYLSDEIMTYAAQLGFELHALSVADLDEDDGTPCECSDYYPFQKAGISFVYFEATNWELGDQDGLTQVDECFGDEGVIYHTRYDNLAYIDSTFPGRIDQHLDWFVSLVYETLVQGFD
ncbi:MAG: M20/M25/M40 family metallo-hydrolase [Chloroflexota bacterium]